MEGKSAVKMTMKFRRQASSRTIGTIFLGAATAVIACLATGSAAPFLACASAGCLIAFSRCSRRRIPHVESRVNESLRSALRSGLVASRRKPAGLRCAAIRRPGMGPGLHLLRRPRIRIRRAPLDMLRRPLRPVLCTTRTMLVRTAA